MLTLSAVADVASARRLLEGATKQLPFVTALALTSAVKQGQAATVKALPSIFDRPTPFTARGIAIQPATKANPTAVLYVRPIQAAAGLLLQETGGPRTPKKRAILMSVAAGRNAYGNLPRTALGTLKKRRDVFVGKIGGVGGFWQRPSKAARRKDDKAAPKLLIAFEDRATYAPRFGFVKRGEAVIRAALAPAFREAVAKAMRTAR